MMRFIGRFRPFKSKECFFSLIANIESLMLLRFMDLSGWGRNTDDRCRPKRRSCCRLESIGARKGVKCWRLMLLKKCVCCC